MAFKAYNAAMPTTAAQASVSTTTSIRTMLQVVPPSTRMLQVISWGFTLDDPPGADAVIELLQTDVAATTGTAHVAAGIYNTDPNGSASLVQLGAALTGFTFTAEGISAAVSVFDAVSLSSTTGESPLTYVYQFMPDERPLVGASKFLRVRATTPTTAVDMRTWVSWVEV